MGSRRPPDSPFELLSRRAGFELTPKRSQWLAGGLAVVSGVFVYLLATQIFPYHTTNHDEAVYLQQAAMLLEGQLHLYPPVPESFRPWFFVDEPEGPRLWFMESGNRLYSKYAPVAAAMFAVGKLLGGYRLALAAIAAGNVALTYTIGAEVFDRRIGLVAGVLLLASPLFLIDSSVFLPYAPTTLWNLVFAFAYLRSVRVSDGGRVYAVVAGGAIGIAFFSRPYTAVLFAAPFIIHALWTLRPVLELDSGTEAVIRRVLTGIGGLVGVGATLGYNAIVTGSPWLFPYAAFAPEDGLGFGHHEILGYARDYTLELALRANIEVVQALFTEWVVAGPLGTLLALVGVGTVGWTAWHRWRGESTAGRHGEETQFARRVTLAGLFVSIIVGNVYFWGNLNILGVLEDPTDGLIAFYGPYYHFDVLVPTAIFASQGAFAVMGQVERVAVWLSEDAGDETAEAENRWIRSDTIPGAWLDRIPRIRPDVTAAILLLVGATVFGGVAVATAQEPISENRAVSQQLAAAYEPFEEQSFENALIFVPTPYGDWLNHPFQHLRNDPGFDGKTVYALRENQFAVVDAFPDRTLYRYTYRGQWAPFIGDPIEPRIQRVEAVRGERVTMDTTIGVPAGADRVSLRLASSEGDAYYAVNGTPSNLSLELVIADGRATVRGPVTPTGKGNASVPIGTRDDLLLVAFVDYGPTGGFSYRFELPTAQEAGKVRALTPYPEVCRMPVRCGGEAAYIPSETNEGVFMRVHVSASNDPQTSGSRNASESAQ